MKTIRYYEEIGVLPLPERSSSGYRMYDEPVVDRLHFIRASQSVGFTLGEIREIVTFRDQGDAPCAHVLDLLHRHREECVERIKELRHVEGELGSLVQRAMSLRPEDCTTKGVCHLIPQTA